VESAFDLRDRVMRFLDFVHDVPCVRVIAVTHGDVLNAFRWCLEGLSLSEFRDLFRDKTNFIPFGCALTWDNGRNTMTKSTLDDGVLDPIAIRLSSEWAYSAIPTNFDKD
jgi:broad specificity phosphatase PhoE